MSSNAPGGETQLHSPAGDMALVLYRLNEFEKKLDRVINDYEARLRKAEDAVARLQERLAIVTAGLASLSIVSSAIAAWLGAVMSGG